MNEFMLRVESLFVHGIRLKSIKAYWEYWRFELIFGQNSYIQGVLTDKMEDLKFFPYVKIDGNVE